MEDIVFFFLAVLWGQSPLTTPLSTHIGSANFFHAEMAERLVEEHLQSNNLDFAEYEARFNQRVETLSKTLVVLMIPAFALVLGLVTFRKRAFAIQHLVFSCHLYAHFLLYNFIIVLGFMLLLFSPLQKVLSPDMLEFLVSGISMIVIGTFLFFGLRRAYDLKKWTSLTGSVLLAVGVYAILLLYRAILFVVTFYSLSF